MEHLTELYIKLIKRQIKGFIACPDGELAPLKGLGRKISLYSGSFNPLHDGHKSVFNAIQGDKYFEISIERRDKDSLEHDELAKRISQFKWYAPIIVTNAPKYLDKIKIFGKKSLIFHIGIDTARRILQDDDIKTIEKMNAKFIVYDRRIDGVLRSLRNLRKVPKNFIQGSTPDIKYLHVNSTELRK